MGEAIEEFMQFAEGLKHQTAQGRALIGASTCNAAVKQVPFLPLTLIS